jgi:hypothetical protein
MHGVLGNHPVENDKAGRQQFKQIRTRQHPDNPPNEDHRSRTNPAAFPARASSVSQGSTLPPCPQSRTSKREQVGEDSIF